MLNHKRILKRILVSLTAMKIDLMYGCILERERQHGAGIAPVGRLNFLKRIKAVPAICFYEPTI